MNALGRPEITLQQLATIIIICILTAGNASIISAIFDFAGRDIYFSLLLSMVYMLLLVSIYTKLAQRFPRHSIIQYAPALLGKFLGKIIGILYILFFIAIPILVSMEVNFLMLTSFSPQIPVIVIALLHFIPKVYLVWLGLESMVRITQIITLPALLLMVLFVLLNIPNYQLQLLQPFLNHGLVPLLLGTVLMMARMGYLSLSLMVYPYLKSTSSRRLFKTQIMAMAAITLALAASYSVIMIYGERQTQNFLFPTFAMIRMIEIGDFLERLDPLLLGVWWFGYWILGAIFYYAGCLAIQQWAGLKHYRQTVLPLGVIMVMVVALGFRSNFDFRALSVYVITPLLLVLTFLVPLLLLMIAAARGIDSQQIDQRKKNK
ncbi:endospore germination permease [Peptococcaceae bacterium 1198_IL3148]